jgi:purine-binding chemotaxis protein CheW
MGQPGQIATTSADGGAGVDRSGGMSLVFRAGTMLCALRLDEAIETMRPLAVQPLAGAPAHIRGISIMRGTPTPVIDVARLLGGRDAPVSRFIAVRTDRGPIAFATGAVLGIRSTAADSPQYAIPLLGAAPSHLVASVGTVDTEPLFLLQSMRLVPDEVWAVARTPVEPVNLADRRSGRAAEPMTAPA